MAKFVGGPPPFIGSRDNVTIYLMNGEYFIRSKSSLTAKRVKRDPAFARTMEYAGWLKKASVIASVVYRQIPKIDREYKQYKELVGKAMGLLKEGLDVDAVLTVLEATYLHDKLSDSLSDNLSDNLSHNLSDKLFHKLSDILPEDSMFVNCTRLDESGRKRNDNSDDSRGRIAVYKVFEKEMFVKKRKSIGNRRFQVGMKPQCTITKSVLSDG